ncbi:MAG: ABC transporter permease [Luteolibacter sp.]|jgi:phospholipid/cholesterol/gamma-HCH transport system permease protein|nr:ABC transporter permease [Luteolibacter sp.]
MMKIVPHWSWRLVSRDYPAIMCFMTAPEATPPRALWLRDGGRVLLDLSGEWRRGGTEPVIEGEAGDRLPEAYVTDGLGTFDSTLPAFLLAMIRRMEAAEPPLEGLPPNLHGLMELALAVPEEIEARGEPEESTPIKVLGAASMNVWAGVRSINEFTGQSMLSLGRFMAGRARFRPRDFWMIVEDCGAKALPIVSLISFLIGLILAFVGNVQLANFGASLYVADLVGIAMVREMGVVMTAIIMSGRTGAAFAAHLGSMKANQEIDALRTFGFDPFDFLVLPRMLALVLMMPLLTVYSNIIGILGGMLVGAAVGIPPILYWNETLSIVTLENAFLGVFKSVFFGIVIAMCGCLQGMHAGNSSAAVGLATTRAVVASISAIIVLDSAFAAIFTILDI